MRDLANACGGGGLRPVVFYFCITGPLLFVGFVYFFFFIEILKMFIVLNPLSLTFFRDNYAFVTYYSKNDAFAAIERGTKLRQPNELPFDICFGGRRQFCQSDYADLGIFIF